MALDPRYRFDNYVVGSANRLAVAAAHAVAESPGTVYNPLLIYSASGLGKTHLLVAIGQRAREVQPGLTIDHAPMDDFVEQLHAAISTGQTDAFKQRYQHVDLLLLDDIQFLSGRRETQSELLRLFNALQGSGRQIVLTSDRPPGEIPDVDERLITRLSGGLIVDIGEPDYETRVAILRNKCEERGMAFRTGVLEELAQIDFANVRELQGALNRLIAYQALEQNALEARQVRSVIGERPVTSRAPAAVTPRRSTPGMAPVVPGKMSMGEYQNFLTDISVAVATHVDAWRHRLSEAIAYWQGEGYRTEVLERGLSENKPPEVGGLIEMFVTAVEHLRHIEAEATRIDPALGAHEMFRDPQRVAEAEALLERAHAGQTPPPGPSAAFTRATFEVSGSNQIAAGAADTVIGEPGVRYNPLFLHGPSGVGKTHLINAIGNELYAATGGAMNVSLVSAQTFIDELIAALQEGTVDRWRARYRAADVLIIDDIQFVAGKERTQEELFHVFNALYAERKQIIISSDRPPRELESLEDRLRSRFEGGLVAELHSPDRQLREKLYARYLSALHPPAEPGVVPYLAARPAGSVREIIGTVNRLVSAADIMGVPLSVAIAKAELEGAGSAPVPPPASIRASVDPFFLDDEKVVWDWPDVGGRVIEEFR